MKNYASTRTRQYHTNQVKFPDAIVFSLDVKSTTPKVVGVSRDGKFRSFAYIPVGGCTTNAKRSIYREYREFKTNV